MKLLCYRGVFYEYAQLLPKKEIVEKIERSPQHLHPKIISQSMQVLCYRGSFYLREMRSSNLRLTSLEVVHLPNNSMQSDVSDGSCIMHIQRMGSLYKLYCLGWRNGSLKCFPPLQHWLLSIFLYYRRGFAEGSEWRQNQMKR